MSAELVRIEVERVLGKTHHGAESDEQLVAIWLHGRSTETQRAYRADAEALRSVVTKPLAEVRLVDLQNFADSLTSLQPASRHRRLSAVKSMFAFAHRIGYLNCDVSRVLKLPVLSDRLAERILPETDVHRMLALTRHPRDYALLFLLYATGVRVSECCSLQWRSLQDRGDGGQITVLGKGGQTRAVLLPNRVWQCVLGLRGQGDQNAPVFRSKRGGHLHPTQVRRIVRAAARRAGIERNVSPHWMRHAHASHALDRGAPIHLVQQTLGHASLRSTSAYAHSLPTESSSSYLSL